MQSNSHDYLEKVELQLAQLNKDLDETIYQMGLLENKMFKIRRALYDVTLDLRGKHFKELSKEETQDQLLAESKEQINTVKDDATKVSSAASDSEEENRNKMVSGSCPSNEKPIEIRYSSMLVGQGFDRIDTTDVLGLRSIYVIEVMSADSARFYPIFDNANRMIKNRQELLDPVCEADVDIEPDDFRITSENYGTLRLDDSNNWVVVKPCRIAAK